MKWRSHSVGFLRSCAGLEIDLHTDAPLRPASAAYTGFGLDGWVVQPYGLCPYTGTVIITWVVPVLLGEPLHTVGDNRIDT